MSQRALLLSLHPRFARAILDGSKTVEVRRRPVRAAPGTRVILYASTPVRAVVGVGRIQRSVVCEPETAWDTHRHHLGLERDEFDSYLQGRNPCLLLLEDVQTLTPPLQLVSLRSDGPFRPPQSYRYVNLSDPVAIKHLAEASSRSDSA